MIMARYNSVVSCSFLMLSGRRHEESKGRERERSKEGWVYNIVYESDLL